MSEQRPNRKHGKHKSYATTLLFLVVFCLIFSVFVIPMGLANTLNTLMNTAYDHGYRGHRGRDLRALC